MKKPASIEQFSSKLRSWNTISSIEMIGEVAVFKTYDGTKNLSGSLVKGI